ncbi:Retrotransposon Polyprotein [Phytophthora palmivora]|uniref:Retrotransposon Polyprotein n=1 Tax=Phytophthora palmivora TaxID=4796 RepID=A0A2P4XT39_9STRA|nr:Retrotransposon Polyprotein [Phytophthora palmivora]
MANPSVHMTTHQAIYRLVKLDILFPNNDSEWTSPACVIPKKDESLLPAASDRKPAALVPQVEYVFRCLPMGVSTAWMSTSMMLGDLDGIWAYLNDVLLMSDSFEEHLELLRRVFKRFEEFSLTIHSPLHNKVEAIAKIASPRTRRELRRFIGMVNYYRDIWPRRAAILSLPTALISPSVPFRWSDEHETAFARMKTAMIQTVELAFPDYSKPFHMHTDASGYQLGAVISQDGRPLVFWSKRCNDAQKKYPANTLELLIIKLVCHRGQQFIGFVRIHPHYIIKILIAHLDNVSHLISRVSSSPKPDVIFHLAL